MRRDLGGRGRGVEVRAGEEHGEGLRRAGISVLSVAFGTQGMAGLEAHGVNTLPGGWYPGSVHGHMGSGARL